MITFEDGPWRGGINSVDDPCTLPAGQYQWAVNCINKGGVISTRPGQNTIENPTKNILGTTTPRGFKLFTPRNGVTEMVVAKTLPSNLCGIFHLPYPFTGDWTQISGITFGDHPVEMEVAVIGVTEDPLGNITAVDPYPVLMICDGFSRTAYWDGVTARHLDPSPLGAHETPPARWMKWAGNRLWTAQGGRVRASNLLNPLKFTEEDILSEGGYFNLSEDSTGFGTTPDFRNLLAFTNFTTTSFQSGILNRATWGSTQDFQKVIFSNIGCAAGRSIVNQYGMTWWMSHSGLINLDSAQITYRSSQIMYLDAAMRRSRANFSDDISGICATAYGNYLLISVPSGDLHNYHTWVLDGHSNESAVSAAESYSSARSGWSSVWTGIRPVQYATGVVLGRARCFALSDDIPATAATELVSPNVWELFLTDRRDIGSGIISVASTAKNVSCGFETKSIPTGQLCSVKFVDLDLENIVGTVLIDIYYATRRGTYKKFGTKQIVGTVGSVISTMTLPVTFASYLPQKRSVRSANESIISTDNNPGVETPYTKGIDKYFSFLIKWTGQMSVTKIRVYAEPEPEQPDGQSEVSETTDRYIRPTGDGAILATGPTDLPITTQQSSFLSTTSPRWAEEIYKSLP